MVQKMTLGVFCISIMRIRGRPSWSLDDRSQDGTNDWFRGGWIEPPNSGGPPLGTRSWAILETHRRFEIKLESVSIPDEDSRHSTPFEYRVVPNGARRWELV